MQSDGDSNQQPAEAQLQMRIGRTMKTDTTQRDSLLSIKYFHISKKFPTRQERGCDLLPGRRVSQKRVVKPDSSSLSMLLSLLKDALVMRLLGLPSLLSHTFLWRTQIEEMFSRLATKPSDPPWDRPGRLGRPRWAAGGI